MAVNRIRIVLDSLPGASRKRGVRLNDAGFARLLHQIRERERRAGRMRMTIDEIAAQTPVSARTMRRILSGESAIDRRTLDTVFAAFGMQLSSTDLMPTRRSLATRLPRPLSAFVGRRRECEELAAAARTQRLVTIVGAGGVGKSRVALETLAHAADTSRGRTVWVELALLHADADIAQAVASALHVLRAGAGDPFDAIAAALGTEPSIVALDNCEHLSAPVAAFATRLLVAVPSVRILATSRVALKVPGEALYRLAPLSLDDATALFLDRAESSGRRPAAGGGDSLLVDAICRSLDGLPFTVELVAARLRSQTLAQLHRGLVTERNWESAGGAVGSTHHHGLTEMISWSLGLLSTAEREMLDAIAAFEGAFAVEAALLVAGAPDRAQRRVFDGLIEQSLVLEELREGAERYRLLASTRDVVRELLNSDMSTRSRSRHAHVFRDVALAALERGGGAPDDALLLEVDEAEPDVVAAIGWFEESDLFAQAAETALAMRHYWIVRHHHRLLANVYCRLLDSGKIVAMEALATLNGFAGFVLAQLSRLDEARARCEAGVAAARACAPPVLSSALNALGVASLLNGDAETAVAALEECAALCLAGDDVLGSAKAQQNLGAVAFDLSGDPAAARAAFERAHALFARAGSEHGRMMALGAVAEVDLIDGRFAAVRDTAGSIISIAKRLQAPTALCDALRRTGLCESYLGNRATGASLLLEAIESAASEASDVTLAEVVEAAAFALIEAAAFDAARNALSVAEQIRVRAKRSRVMTENVSYQRALDRLRVAGEDPPADSPRTVPEGLAGVRSALQRLRE